VNQHARIETVEVHDPRPPEFSDDALALRFSERHGETMRYVAKWARWLQWRGNHWEFDDTVAVFDMARAICREAAAECNQAKVSSAIASAKTVSAVERLARSDRRHAATVDQWDGDPWLLNTPGGVIDLRSGASRPARPEDHLTKITTVAPGGECQRWLKFLAEITAGDAELQSYLRRVLGYALTGDTREHALFFGYGTGRNGKSVLLKTAADILGNYHKTASIDTFTASNTDRHPTDLAGLQGARLVTAIETEEGRRWAESRIKTLTGGDRVAARFMRQDFFEFTPQFKLIIAGNHKPSLRSVDEAIRRRFHLIPFAVTIAAEEADAELPEKLKAEWPGILSWMVHGCLEWRREGLKPPQSVRDATAAYLEAEDAIAAWIDDKCERDAKAWSTRAELFGSWSAWADSAGEYAGSMKAFNEKLETRGFHQHRDRRGRGFYGLRVLGASDA
jgi:putative DNA primase/helicase